MRRDKPDLIQGLAPEHAEALKLRESEWAAPRDLSLSNLKQEPRLHLFEVLDFLAFGKTQLPDNISRLMHIAHRERAFRALCAAAKADKVEIFGTPRGGSARQRIGPIEFDVRLALADEDGAISLDLDALTVERFVEARRQQWLWRDVYVDRQSLVGWLSKLPAEKRRQAGARGKNGCIEWLVELRESGPPEKTKAEYESQAAKRFEVGPDQFRTAWKHAEIRAPSQAWGVPGRRHGWRK
jgi:hypothetical protein